MKKIILTLILLLSSLNCLSHNEGIIADIGRPQLTGCLNGYEEIRHPVLTNFLQFHVNQIITSNHSELASLLDKGSGFCVRADYLRGSFRPNFGAFVDSGQILMTPNFVPILLSEPQVAAILAHEISHVAMYHSSEEPIPFIFRAGVPAHIVSKLRDVRKKMVELIDNRHNREAFFSIVFSKIKQAIENDLDQNHKSRFEKTVSEFKDIQSIPLVKQNMNSHPIVTNDEIYSQLISIAKTYGISIDLVSEYHDAILNDLSLIAKDEVELKEYFGDRYKRSIFNNFKEEEADEVGLEYYIRAGYDPNKFEESLLIVLMNQKEDITSINEAREHCEQLKADNKIVRSEDSHPHLCWRYFNIRNELKEHADYYKQFQQDTKNTTSINPSFDDFKSSFKAENK